MQIGRYNVEGPFSSEDSLKDISGVYAILGRNSKNENWTVVDVGESAKVKTRISNHDRKSCWKKQNFSILNVAVLYTNKITREQIEIEWRNEYNPPCGDR